MFGIEIALPLHAGIRIRVITFTGPMITIGVLTFNSAVSPFLTYDRTQIVREASIVGRAVAAGEGQTQRFYQLLKGRKLVPAPVTGLPQNQRTLLLLKPDIFVSRNHL